jgi:hypothetical protein
MVDKITNGRKRKENIRLKENPTEKEEEEARERSTTGQERW